MTTVLEIGDGFFESNFTWGIVPAINVKEDRYIVVLQNGEKCGIQATADTVRTALLKAGYNIHAADIN